MWKIICFFQLIIVLKSDNLVLHKTQKFKLKYAHTRNLSVFTATMILNQKHRFYFFGTIVRKVVCPIKC